MESCFLYKIENKVNGKLYIGITNYPKIRMQQHFYGKRKDSISLVKQAINKYGPENFTFEVLCEGSREYIVDLEMKAIVLYDTINTGYNIRSGGEDCGTGHKILKRSDDKYIYVTGFWFPNTRTCQEKTGISDFIMYKWKKSGNLGDVQHLRKDSLETPLYVSGFWFDTITRASASLNMKRSAINKRLVDNSLEEKNRNSDKGKSDAGYHMSGRTGFSHPNSKSVNVNGVVYGSILEAARNTEFTKRMIERRLKNNTPGFSWAIQENI